MRPLRLFVFISTVCSFSLRYQSYTNFNPNETLRSAAERAGIYFGAALAAAHLQNSSDPEFFETSFQQFNLATAENECKFASTEPSEANFTLLDCSFVMNSMVASGGVARLHNFAWAGDNPGWLFNRNFSNATLLNILQNHIKHVGGTFSGKVFSTDVVNEPFCNVCPNPETHDPYLKPMPPWYPAIPDYIYESLQAAKQADPLSLRFINDYGGEGLGGKSDIVYNYSRLLVTREPGLLNGIGLQCHLDVDDFPPALDVAANIARLGALGLKVHITEMDVRCTPPCGQDRLALQAKIYGDIVEACLNSTNICQSVETWGVTDRYSWLWDFDNPHKVDMQPLLFDINYNKKPAFYEVLAVLQMAAEEREKKKSHEIHI